MEYTALGRLNPPTTWPVEYIHKLKVHVIKRQSSLPTITRYAHFWALNVESRYYAYLPTFRRLNPESSRTWWRMTFRNVLVFSLNNLPRLPISLVLFTYMVHLLSKFSFSLSLTGTNGNDRQHDCPQIIFGLWQRALNERFNNHLVGI